MADNINPISLDEFVDLVKPKSGIVIYASPSGGGLSGGVGNDFSNWDSVARIAKYHLACLGVPTLTINESYVSPYQRMIDSIQKDFSEIKALDSGISHFKAMVAYFDNQKRLAEERLAKSDFYDELKRQNEDKMNAKLRKRPDPSEVQSLEEKLSKYQKLKEQDERYAKSHEELILKNGTGLWLSGCFCCLNYNSVAKMAKRFKKGKAGILVPRDHHYLDNNPTTLRLFGGEYIDHFVFVAPDLKSAGDDKNVKNIDS